MRILYHHRTLGDGAEGIHIAEMVNAFRQLGNEVLVVGPAVDHVGGKEVGSNRFGWIRKICKGPLYEIAEIAYNIYGFMNICRKIFSFKPDFIYDRYITFNYSAIAAGNLTNVPVFIEVNSPLAYERDTESDELLFFKKIAYLLERKICTDADSTFVVSTPLKKYLSDKGVPSGNIIILPNGVNTDRFYPCGERNASLSIKLQICEQDIVVGFVGILRPWHGIDFLIKSIRPVFEKYPNLKLLLVGDGPIRREIETLVGAANLQGRIVITGRVPHDEVRGYLSLFDIAISPKATFYASPMKIVEYMASGVPVVAPDMENIRDLIIHKHSGMLFQPDSKKSLAAAVSLLVSNFKMREDIKKNALDAVRLNLSWSKNAQQVTQVYQKLTDGTFQK